MPINIFQMDKRDLRKLQQFMKQSPKQFQAATKGVLNSLAFSTHKYDKSNIHKGMIVRDENFIKKSLRVIPARSGPIERQVAYEGSLYVPSRAEARGTGWVEQQKGVKPRKERVATRAGRGGSQRSKMISKARLRTGRKFYKPEQFSGRSYQQKFYFMMRIIGRVKGDFILSQNVPTRKGQLGRGLYTIQGHKLTRLQVFKKGMRPKHLDWHAMSLNELRRKNDIITVWSQQLNRIVNRYKTHA